MHSGRNQSWPNVYIGGRKTPLKSPIETILIDDVTANTLGDYRDNVNLLQSPHTEIRSSILIFVNGGIVYMLFVWKLLIV